MSWSEMLLPRVVTARSPAVPHASSKACHLHTCCPFDSFISVQWLSSSSPELFRPKEIQPIISFLFMLRLLYTDSMSVTSESWNRATWKTKVSLYTGFGCPLRVDVLHLDISCPMEFRRVNLTYVSTAKNNIPQISFETNSKHLSWNICWEGWVLILDKDMVYTMFNGNSTLIPFWCRCL